MKLSFNYKGIKVTYYLTYKRAKAISIKITEKGQVNVIAPIGTPVFSVMDKVKGNAPWIISQIYNKPDMLKQEVTLFEQYTYLGKNYKLEVIDQPSLDKVKVKMLRGKFVVETPTRKAEEIRNALVEWYKPKITAKVKERLNTYCSAFEKVPEEIKVVDEKELLFKGSSTEMVIDVKFGCLPVEIIDYILLTHLCHFEKDGEAKMKELLPTYEKSKQWLDENKKGLRI